MRPRCRRANASFGEKQEWWTSCSREQPYKWYVAAFKTDAAQPGFNKVVAVLTERNWYRVGPARRQGAVAGRPRDERQRGDRVPHHGAHARRAGSI